MMYIEPCVAVVVNLIVLSYYSADVLSDILKEISISRYIHLVCQMLASFTVPHSPPSSLSCFSPSPPPSSLPSPPSSSLYFLPLLLPLLSLSFFLSPFLLPALSILVSPFSSPPISVPLLFPSSLSPVQPHSHHAEGPGLSGGGGCDANG